MNIKNILLKTMRNFCLLHIRNLEEIFENREQIEISKHYEGLPKPTAIATQELLDDKIYLRDPEEASE